VGSPDGKPPGEGKPEKTGNTGAKPLPKLG